MKVVRIHFERLGNNVHLICSGEALRVQVLHHIFSLLLENEFVISLSPSPNERIKAKIPYQHVWPIESVFDCAIDLCLSGCTNLCALRLDTVVVQKYTSVIVWTCSGINKRLIQVKYFVKVNVQMPTEYKSYIARHSTKFFLAWHSTCLLHFVQDIIGRFFDDSWAHPKRRARVQHTTIIEAHGPV
jgi:hypothetical protein